MKDLIRQIRKSKNLNQPLFAELVGVSKSTVCRWESGDRTPTGHDEIGALLRVAPPELQAQLLQALGIEDVTRFATDLLASAGVMVVQVEGKIPNGA